MGAIIISPCKRFVGVSWGHNYNNCGSMISTFREGFCKAPEAPWGVPPGPPGSPEGPWTWKVLEGSCRRCEQSKKRSHITSKTFLEVRNGVTSGSHGHLQKQSARAIFILGCLDLHRALLGPRPCWTHSRGFTCWALLSPRPCGGHSFVGPCWGYSSKYS